MIILSNIFGFIGICATIVIYQQKSRKSLLVSKLASDLIWFLHYLFLGAYSGAAVAMIGACREIVFVNRDKKWGKSKLWLPAFIAVAILSTVLTWKNIYSALTCVASVLAVISYFIGKPKLSRIIALPISSCMFIYDIANRSLMGIANECLAIGSSVVGLLIIDRKRRNNDVGEKADA